MARRSHRLRVGAALVGALVLGLAVGLPIGLLTRGHTSTPQATTSPARGAASAARSLYQRTLVATRASAGFHYVNVSTGGSGTETITGDAGSSSGRQVITLVSPYGQEQFNLVLLGGTVYFQGNGPAVQDQLGVPAAGAAGVAGRWVSVFTSDGPYAVVAPGITVADQAQEISFVPTSTLHITTATGTAATRIVGTPPAQAGTTGEAAHLDVATGSHLPLSEVSTMMTAGGVPVDSTTTFSGWGTTPQVGAPAGAVAWSTLGASMPTGGYGSGGPATTPSPTP